MRPSAFNFLGMATPGHCYFTRVHLRSLSDGAALHFWSTPPRTSFTWIARQPLPNGFVLPKLKVPDNLTSWGRPLVTGVTIASCTIRNWIELANIITGELKVLPVEYELGLCLDRGYFGGIHWGWVCLDKILNPWFSDDEKYLHVYGRKSLVSKKGEDADCSKIRYSQDFLEFLRRHQAEILGSEPNSDKVPEGEFWNRDLEEELLESKQDPRTENPKGHLTFDLHDLTLPPSFEACDEQEVDLMSKRTPTMCKEYQSLFPERIAAPELCQFGPQSINNITSYGCKNCSMDPLTVTPREDAEMELCFRLPNMRPGKCFIVYGRDKLVGEILIDDPTVRSVWLASDAQSYFQEL